MSDKQKGNIGVTIFFLLLAVGILFSSFYKDFVSKKQQEGLDKQIADKVTEKVTDVTTMPSEYPDYYAALTLSSTTVIYPTITTAQSSNNFSPLTKNLTLTGKFQRMYFLIKASVDFGKPLSVYDDIYLNLTDFNLNKKLPFKNGAHLTPSDSLPTPPGAISTLLYSANALQLKQFSTGNRVQVDALAVFNNEKQLTIQTTVSTAREGGNLSFIIYYECATGSTCSIIPN